MRRTTIWTIAVALSFTWLSFAHAQGEARWPRKFEKPGGSAIVYPPQVDTWKNFTELTWRQAFQITPAGGKMVVGAATLEATTDVDSVSHLVHLRDIRVVNTYFPSLDPASTERMNQLVRTLVPNEVTTSLERVAAYVKTDKPPKTASLKNDPPRIFIAYAPAILLGIDGKPVLSELPQTGLKLIVNTTWPLFQDSGTGDYYLLVNDVWLTSHDLQGKWSRTMKLPPSFAKLPDSGRLAEVKKAVPPPRAANAVIPSVFFSTEPAEVILFEGRPSYTTIPGTQLMYASNTDSPLFFYTPTRTYFYLTAGRWFSADSLDGRWKFASSTLPADFARIPPSSPAGAIRASVPGTPEAKDAVLIAQIPTTMTINPTTAASKASVTYAGDPKFAPIEGTNLKYATNTPDKVIQVGDLYYLCLQGVWFRATKPQGPWETAPTVPSDIYTIPPSSPLYNVTYVTQTTAADGSIQASYTAGYLGAFVTGAALGAIVASGTGYYYPPYIGPVAGVVGYPAYYPRPTPYGAVPYYNTRTGAYGYSQTAHGPYGSSTRAAQYNPYTGTYARGASTSTAYGRQSVGQAYNPYTGTYAASHQGSSPTAQWGQSYVARGSQSAYAQHYATAAGTVGSAQGSHGGQAYAKSGAYGNTYAGRSAGGDIYAGHDGNVYQNTGTGWQKYNNTTGSWSTVNTTQAQHQAQQQAQTYEQQHPQQLTQPRSVDSSSNATQAQHQVQQQTQTYEQQHPQEPTQPRSIESGSTQTLDSERQARWSGAAQNERFQQFQRSGGGLGGGGDWGGGHSFGGLGGGGRAWGGGLRR